jgi:hypothetical protein
MVAIAPVPTSASAPAAPPAAPKTPDHLSFGDLLDIINPLQHIPIVSTIYRKLTGDTMSPTAEIFGGALYGGIIGAAASIADVLFTRETGSDFGDTVMAWLGFGNDSGVEFAKTDAKPAPAAPPTLPQGSAGAVPGLAALSAALAKRRFDPALRRQATLAYENAIGVSIAAAKAGSPLR